MFSLMIKLLKRWQRRMHNNAWQREPPPAPSPDLKADSQPSAKDQLNDKLSTSLTRNITMLAKTLGNANDVKARRFSFGLDYSLHGALFYIDGLADETTLRDGVLTPLMSRDFAAKGRIGMPGILSFLKTTSICSSDIIQVGDRKAVSDAVLSGDAAFMLDGSDHALIISSKGWEKRSISEPQTASVVRGPRDGFTETLRTNTMLIRRRLKTHNLRMESITLGKQTKTDVCIVYIKDIVRPELLNIVRKRLKAVNIDAIPESSYIEQIIEDDPFSIFPTIGATERPDTVAAKILEGRIAIIVDGSPFVLTVPYLYMEAFQDPADYYNRPYYASLIRIVRYFAFYIAIMGPALFVALTTFHPEMIPTTLLLTILKLRETTPFPSYIEALILVISFEIIREAGLRLPKPIGQTISIVGALIMGEAAVSAGIVGTTTVIIVAITIVSTFIIPDFNDPIGILRLVMLSIASAMGIYGILLAFFALQVHLSSLNTFGIPYLSGIAPPHPQYAKDLFVRMPLWLMRTRPDLLVGKNVVRSQTKKPPPAATFERSEEESEE
ncbi:MAG TPA: spore germination protein [Clostridiales bacterium]|nr:spore germination protein [Clostridiales bacterium]